MKLCKNSTTANESIWSNKIP